MMTKLATLYGVKLLDGRVFYTNDEQTIVLYDQGVQEEDYNGCTLWGWDEIAIVYFRKPY